MTETTMLTGPGWTPGVDYIRPDQKMLCDIFRAVCGMRAVGERPYLAQAVLVTRGDVEMDEVNATFASWPPVVTWNNERQLVDLRPLGQFFAALLSSRAELVYFQDDDVLVSHPGQIVRALLESGGDNIVCNMPQTHRPNYVGQLDRLMGFGSCFRRQLIAETFSRYFEHFEPDQVLLREPGRIFTGLNTTRLVEVDVPKVDRACEANENRLWRQPDHIPMRDEARRRVAVILEAERANGKGN